VYELRGGGRLPSVTNTLIKSIGLALLFSFYIVTLMVVKGKIYERVDIDKFRSRVFEAKRGVE
jgi:hypothetical protein